MDRLDKSAVCKQDCLEREVGDVVEWENKLQNLGKQGH